MKPSKYLNDPVLSGIVDKIAEGTLTRAAAAESLGISVATFNSRLTRAKLSEKLKPLRKYDGDHLFKPDPVKSAAYQAAIEQVRNTPASLRRGAITKAAKDFGVNPVVLGRKLKPTEGEQE